MFINSCLSNKENKTEKFQKHRNKIANIKGEIIDIKTDINFRYPHLYIIDSILVISDSHLNMMYGIHLFNKKTFKYIKSTGILGRGPGEIVNLGYIGIDQKNKVLWVADYGKKVQWKFYLDSVLNNDMYKPKGFVKINYDMFMERYGFLNDSVILGKTVRILPDHSFVKVMAKLNLNTNDIEVYGYEHPECSGKRSSSVFKMSIKNNMYVNGYFYCDLMTICDLDGRLKYNVYGPGWLKNIDNNNNYFFGLDFINGHIIASFLGDEGIYYDENKRLRGNIPTKFLVFDLRGDYIETIETEHKILSFCVDEKNNRVIAYFEDREPPLGYFDFNFE